MSPLRSLRHIVKATSWLIVLPLALAACTQRSDPAFAPLQQATLASGRGFAELPLGTTLAQFAGRFGKPDRIGAIAGDIYAADLIYEVPALTFRFQILPACVQALQHDGRAVELLAGLRKPSEFLGQHPSCADAPLQSIAAAGEGKSAWFQGATAQGVHLDADKDTVLRSHGGSQSVIGVSLAGSSADDSAYDELLYADGLALYLGPADGGAWRVRRIVVFAPLRE